MEGVYFPGNFNSYPNVGLTNYVGSAGSLGNVATEGDTFYGQFVGPYYTRSQMKTAQLTDGSSNTIAFGESLGGTSQGARDWSLSWMGAGAYPLAWNLITPTQWYTFGSRHTAVVQFAFADGSVKGIRKLGGNNSGWFTPQWYNLMYAGGMQDGFVIDYSQILN
jgi:prepilin-type processing-associated H-X9-DG protein